MPTKITMDSGKEYTVDLNAEDLIESLFTVQKMPNGGSFTKMQDTFLSLNNDKTIFINPTHVSSVETVD